MNRINEGVRCQPQLVRTMTCQWNTHFQWPPVFACLSASSHKQGLLTRFLLCLLAVTFVSPAQLVRADETTSRDAQPNFRLIGAAQHAASAAQGFRTAARQAQLDSEAAKQQAAKQLKQRTQEVEQISKALDQLREAAEKTSEKHQAAAAVAKELETVQTAAAKAARDAETSKTKLGAGEKVAQDKAKETAEVADKAIETVGKFEEALSFNVRRQLDLERFVALVKKRLEQAEAFQIRAKTAHENAEELFEKIKKNVAQFETDAKQQAANAVKAEAKCKLAFDVVQEAARELAKALADAREGANPDDRNPVGAVLKASDQHVEASRKAQAALVEANRLVQSAQQAFEQVLLARNASVSAELTKQQTENTLKSAATAIEEARKEIEEAESELKATVEATKQLEEGLAKARSDADTAIAAAHAAANDAAKVVREGQQKRAAERQTLIEESRRKVQEATAKLTETWQELELLADQSERFKQAIAYNELQLRWAKTSERLARSLVSLTETTAAKLSENAEAATKSFETIENELKSLTETK